MSPADDFQKHLIAGDILDSPDVHHEFASGLHGAKLDFDAIPDNSPLFTEWQDTLADKMRELYDAARLKDVVLVSVANGTNRVVPGVATRLANGASYLLTEKSSPKSVVLTADSQEQLPGLKDRFFVVIEDVGTRGTTSASAVRALRDGGATDIEVMNTWQRRPQLEELDAIQAPYNAVIKELLPTYTPKECQREGLCAQGVKLIEHAK